MATKLTRPSGEFGGHWSFAMKSVQSPSTIPASDWPCELELRLADGYDMTSIVPSFAQ